ncbi:hypothetical protein ABH945_001775 [Paraburkholderia sp. GAS333]|uniref:hypothetical protein n=1 Tax=Paraburkholderia sp. GAS333 TaxID=3156279 RepID=UPI003D2377E5
MSKPEFEFTPEDLLKERSLLDVYRIARLTPANGLNVGVTLVVFFICCAYCLAAGENQAPVLTLLRQISSDAIAFTASILGFLVAGFTIFVTTRPEVFYMMAKVEKEGLGVSYLKYNLSIFLLVFIHYLAFTICCVALRVFFSPQGPASLILHAVPINISTAIMIKKLGVASIFILFTSWLFYLLMLLKSFIFNVYHIVMTGVALTIDTDEEDGQS